MTKTELLAEKIGLVAPGFSYDEKIIPQDDCMRCRDCCALPVKYIDAGHVVYGCPHCGLTTQKENL